MEKNKVLTELAELMEISRKLEYVMQTNSKLSELYKLGLETEKMTQIS